MNYNETYEIAIIQAREVINYFEVDLLKKIPSIILKKLNNFKSQNYSFKIDKTKTFEEQNLSKEARELISAIFITYCCSETERHKILEECRKNDIKIEVSKRELYNPSNLFKNNKETIDKHLDIINIEDNKPWYMKIIIKIKKLFKRG